MHSMRTTAVRVSCRRWPVSLLTLTAIKQAFGTATGLARAAGT
jgi:hypothetical protein